MRALDDWGLGLLCAAIALTGAFSCARAEAQDRAVVLMVDAARRADVLGEALSVELAAQQTTVRMHAPPAASSTLGRASEAQAAARELEAEATIWVEEAPAAQGGGALVRAVGRDREEIRHAPLPQPLDAVEPRVFAVVAASLIDEIVSPPESPITVRIEVHVDANGRPVTVVPIVPAPAEAPAPPAPPAPPPAPPPAAPAPVPAPAPPAPPVIVVPATPPPAAPTPPPTPAPPPDETVREVAFGIDFLPYLGTSTFTGGRERRRVSLGVIGALTHDLDGIGLAGVAHIDTGSVRGWELAGVANIDAGPLDGVQLAGVANLAAGPVDGTQVAGVANLAGGPLDGVQIAGVANVAGADVRGFQLAGVANLSGGSLDGTQVAGVANVASGDVDGAQIGLVNVARRVRGVQVGLVNVASESDASIGLVNVIWNGRTQLELLGTESGFGLASIKHGGRTVHSIYGVGARPFGNGTDLALVLGLGGRIQINDDFHVDLDGTCAWLNDEADGGDRDGLRLLNTARASIGFEVTDGLTLVGGISYNVLVSDDPDDIGDFDSPAVTVHRDGDPIATDFGDHEVTVLSWPGVSLGVQLF